MITLGYFNKNPKNNQDDEVIMFSKLSLDQGCMTYSHLIEQITNRVINGPCRVSIETLALQCQVDVPHIEKAIERYHVLNEKKKPTLMRIGNEVLSSLYCDDLIQKLNYSLHVSPTGRLLVSDIALHEFNLPLDITTAILRDRIDSIQGIYSDHESSKQVFSYDYANAIKAQIAGVMKAITVPTSLSNLQSIYSWPKNMQIIPDQKGMNPFQLVSLSNHVAQLCLDSILPGTFNLANSMYTPHIYVQEQQNTVQAFFELHGFITESQAQSFGLATGGHKLYQYIQEKIIHKSDIEVDVLELPKSRVVFQPDQILASLESILLSDTLPNESFIDMRMILPQDFFTAVCNDIDNDTLDIRFIIDYCKKVHEDTSANDEDEGKIIVSHGEALYISPGMVRNINGQILPPLIQEFAKKRAQELYKMQLSSVETSTLFQNEEDEVLTKKGKKGGKRAKNPKFSKISNEKMEENTDLTKTKKRTAKEKRRLKAKSSSSSDSNQKSSGRIKPTLVSLIHVSCAIAKAYPDLAEIQSSINDLDFASLVDNPNNFSNNPSWKLDDPGSNSNSYSSVEDEDEFFYSLTRSIIASQLLATSCNKAVQAEYQKLLQSKRTTTQKRTRHDNATLARTINESFENADCFANACFFLQMMQKAVLQIKAILDKKEQSSEFADTSLGTMDTNMEVKKMEAMLFQCASNFAKRITEYVLFKCDVEDDVFTFSEVSTLGNDLDDLIDSVDCKDSSLPSFCQPVEMGNTKFRTVHISYNNEAKNEMGKEKDVLEMLREELPKEIGTAVAKMWKFCGGEFYQGGVISNRNSTEREVTEGNTFFRPGSFEGFLKHVEESCLIMCGLPFKIMDKKLEKQVMFLRRKVLKQKLEVIQNPKEILVVTSLILFQQVKHLAAAGEFTISAILPILMQERKIPVLVAGKIELFSRLIHENKVEEISTDLINSMKEIGLCKDISKYNQQNS